MHVDFGASLTNISNQYSIVLVENSYLTWGMINIDVYSWINVYRHPSAWAEQTARNIVEEINFGI